MPINFNRGLVTSCQICGSKDLIKFVDLGYHPAVNDFYSSDIIPETVETYPMPIKLCQQCNLVQLGIHVDPLKVFPPNYAYRSGTTKILIENFKNLFSQVKNLINLSTESFVIDIGSNDGTLLKNFYDYGCKVLGVEPTNVYKIAEEQGISSLNKPFSLDTAKQIKKVHGSANIITAANVFAHIENPNDIVEGINHLLVNDGIFVSENHYLFDLIKTLQYDTFYHEHLRYYSLSSLSKLFELHDLRIFHAEKIPTHGGSIRVYTCKKGADYIASDNLKDILGDEEVGLDLAHKLEKFSNDVHFSKNEILHELTKIKLSEKKIVGISAPSRASTLINYLGLDSSIIDYICEVNGSLKIGKNIPGTDIKVINEDFLYKDNPEYALIFSWHIADSLINIIRRNGYKGKFIIPLPKVKIIDR